MNVLELIHHSHVLAKNNHKLNPTAFASCVLVSNEIEQCQTKNDLLDSAAVGLSLLESGEVDATEFRYAIGQIENLEIRLAKRMQEFASSASMN